MRTTILSRYETSYTILLSLPSIVISKVNEILNSLDQRSTFRALSVMSWVRWMTEHSPGLLNGKLHVPQFFFLGLFTRRVCREPRQSPQEAEWRPIAKIKCLWFCIDQVTEPSIGTTSARSASVRNLLFDCFPDTFGILRLFPAGVYGRMYLSKILVLFSSDSSDITGFVNRGTVIIERIQKKLHARKITPPSVGCWA